MIFQKWNFIVGIIILLYHFDALAGSDCNIFTTPNYNISLKDFNVSRSTGSFYFCTASYCDPQEPLKAVIHYFDFSKKYETLIYAGAAGISLKSSCGNCSLDMNNSLSGPGCTPCEKIEDSTDIQIYIRVGSPLEKVTNGKPCELENFFNITLHRKVNPLKNISRTGCEKGFLVSLPRSNSCDIIDLSNAEEMCIEPTCTKDLIINNATDGSIEHKFTGDKSYGICIWKIITEGKKYMEFVYSESIKNNLMLFEETLLSPKWNLVKCSNYKNSLNLRLSMKTLYIMYRSNITLENEASFRIKFKSDLCPLPPIIDHGKDKFLRTENGTISFYSCDEGYKLEGKEKIVCEGEIWEKPPICITDKREVLMSDEPTFSHLNFTNPFIIQGNINESHLHSMEEYEFVVPGSGKPFQEMSTNRSKTLMSDDPKNKSNTSDIELDRDFDDSTVTGTNTLNAETEDGSGNFNAEYDSDYNLSSPIEETEAKDLNASLTFNQTFDPSLVESSGNIFISLPSLEDNLILFIIVGVGMFVIIIITIASIILCRKKGSRLIRTFDTFQNPIYEKPVTRVPIAMSDSDPSQEKLDLGDLSDSTVLDM